VHGCPLQLIHPSSGKRQFLEDARQLGWARDTREFESDEEVSWGISRED
jgi:hypothetical protein